MQEQQYRLFQRGSGVFYLEDRVSRKQESLKTKDLRWPSASSTPAMRPTNWLFIADRWEPFISR